MTKRREKARITEFNDPLSSTEQVLAGIEQVSKSVNQQANKSTSQKDSKSTSQKTHQSASTNSTTNQLKSSSPPQGSDKVASQQVNKSTSHSVNQPALRKATFALSSEVLNQLEQLHLQLQLELGKKNTPYKEVIVEEAISQLLEQAQFNRAELLEALAKRQKTRSS